MWVCACLYLYRREVFHQSWSVYWSSIFVCTYMCEYVCVCACVRVRTCVCVCVRAKLIICSKLPSLVLQNGGRSPEGEARSSPLLTLISLSTFNGSVTSENSSRTSGRWLPSSSKTKEANESRNKPSVYQSSVWCFTPSSGGSSTLSAWVILSSSSFRDCVSSSLRLASLLRS